MMDRESVINEIEKKIKNAEEGFGISVFRPDTLKIIVALLKEQEAKWIHREDLDFKDKLGCTHFHGMCENCGFIHDFIDDHTGQYKYCPSCGQAVKWNE